MNGRKKKVIDAHDMIHQFDVNFDLSWKKNLRNISFIYLSIVAWLFGNAFACVSSPVKRTRREKEKILRLSKCDSHFSLVNSETDKFVKLAREKFSIWRKSNIQ